MKKVSLELKLAIDEALEAGDACAVPCADMARRHEITGRERYDLASKAQRWEKARRHLVRAMHGLSPVRDDEVEKVAS